MVNLAEAMLGLTTNYLQLTIFYLCLSIKMKGSHMKRLSALLILSLIFTSCSIFKNETYAPLEVVPYVDINKYLGKWYEIASLPVSQQEGCNCTTAEYSLFDSTTILVKNVCRKDSVDGEISDVEGKAFVVPGSNNAKLRVQFFWPFRGDYWILHLDKDYKYVLVGVPSRKYFWILSRTPDMDEKLRNELLGIAKEKGFDISKAQITKHCN